MSFCPETWAVLLIIAGFVIYLGSYFFVLRPKQEKIIRWFLKKSKVTRPEKMALYAKQFFPILYWLTFFALVWFLITIYGIRSSSVVQGTWGFGAVGMAGLLIGQKTLLPSGGIHGPEVLLMDMFDEKDWIEVEDPTGHSNKIYEGWVQDVNLHRTLLFSNKLGYQIVPNKALVNMCVLNKDRNPFHFEEFPIMGDEFNKGAMLETAQKHLAMMTERDVIWYQRIFNTATFDGIETGAVPIHLTHDENGAYLNLPVRKHRHAIMAIQELIKAGVVKLR